MNAKEFLTAVMEKSPDELMQYIDNDEEWQEYRKNNPPKDYSSMSREEITEKLIDNLMKLQELVKLDEEKEHDKLRKLLGHQVIRDKELNPIWKYYQKEQAQNKDNTLLFLDIFNYGRICGIRAERARRKGEEYDK